jgi:hypothetical protein
MTDLFKDLEAELDKYSDEEEQVDVKPKKAKKPLSEIAKKARLANLQKGRETRKKQIEQRKKLEKQYEYQEESSESESEEEPVLKRKKVKGKDVAKMKAELDAMKNIVHQLKKKKEKSDRLPVVINNQLPQQYQPQQMQGHGNNNNDDISHMLKTRILKF